MSSTTVDWDCTLVCHLPSPCESSPEGLQATQEEQRVLKEGCFAPRLQVQLFVYGTVSRFEGDCNPKNKKNDIAFSGVLISHTFLEKKFTARKKESRTKGETRDTEKLLSMSELSCFVPFFSFSL